MYVCVIYSVYNIKKEKKNFPLKTPCKFVGLKTPAICYSPLICYVYFFTICIEISPLNF